MLAWDVCICISLAVLLAGVEGNRRIPIFLKA